MLSRTEIISIFQETGALLQGHFLLTSGYHSAGYIQCAKVLQYPEQTKILCEAMVDPFHNLQIDVVIGPATGGIIIAYEAARALGGRALFGERVERKMALRRGFEIKKKERVLVVEDVVTTGGSLREVIDLVHVHGGELVAVGGLVDRSGGKLNFGIPANFLLPLEIEVYPPQKCPLCAKGIRRLNRVAGNYYSIQHSACLISLALVLEHYKTAVCHNVYYWKVKIG